MRLLKAAHKRERGIILVQALIAFALAGLIITPLLGFMNTGMNAARNQGLKTQELYAAEAGIYNGIWKVQHLGSPMDPTDPPLPYSIAGNVNGKSVNGTITSADDMHYKIVSTGADPATGRQVSIETYIRIVNINMFADRALTSPTEVNIQPGGTIVGDVWSPVVNYDHTALIGNISNTAVVGWPTGSDVDLLSKYYYMQVNNTTPYTGNNFSVSNSGQKGPLYVYNGTPGSQYTMSGTGSLQGTIYVNGNLEIEKTANIDLNGQTIYVTGQITAQSTNGYEVNGPGAIIALGDIQFLPQTQVDKFIYVMSVNGQVKFQPNANFVGALAGNTLVDLQPHPYLQWQTPPPTINLPGALGNIIKGINTWKIY